MSTWSQLDTAIGRLKIQLVLTEPHPAWSRHWYDRATREVEALAAELQQANHKAREHGVLTTEPICHCDADLVPPHPVSQCPHQRGNQPNNPPETP